MVKKEEMLERLEEIIKWFPRYQSPALQERRDEIDDAIRSLIENMDKGPKASKGFVEGWAEHFFLAGQEATEKGICWNTYKALIPCVEEMLTELGHEVEEKEATDEPK